MIRSLIFSLTCLAHAHIALAMHSQHDIKHDAKEYITLKPKDHENKNILIHLDIRHSRQSYFKPSTWLDSPHSSTEDLTKLEERTRKTTVYMLPDYKKFYKQELAPHIMSIPQHSHEKNN